MRVPAWMMLSVILCIRLIHMNFQRQYCVHHADFATAVICCLRTIFGMRLLWKPWLTWCLNIEQTMTRNYLYASKYFLVWNAIAWDFVPFNVSNLFVIVLRHVTRKAMGILHHYMHCSIHGTSDNPRMTVRGRAPHLAYVALFIIQRSRSSHQQVRLLWTKWIISVQSLKHKFPLQYAMLSFHFILLRFPCREFDSWVHPTKV